MYTGLVHLHSTLRYVVLIFLIISIVKAISGWRSNSAFTAGDNRWSLLTLISVHLQLVIGFILFFISPLIQRGLADMQNTMSNDILRFFTVEHTLMMLISIILITVGRVKAKKAEASLSKHKKTAIYFGIGLLLILLSIPWPFRDLGRGWF